jgi:hypothetical protein
MISMQVCEKQGFDVVHTDVDLAQTLSNGSTDIEKQLFRASLYKGAGGRNVRSQAGTSSAEQSDLELLRAQSSWRK